MPITVAWAEKTDTVQQKLRALKPRALIKSKTPRASELELVQQLNADLPLPEDSEVNQEDSAGMTVPQALANLQDKINRFQNTVDHCTQELLGRVEENQGKILNYLVAIAGQNNSELSTPLPLSTRTIDLCDSPILDF